MLSMLSGTHLVLPLLILPLLAGIVVYLVFMFKKDWYSQTLMALAAIGAIIAAGIGIRRINELPGDWTGPTLLIAGLFMLVVIGIVARKLFAKKAT